MLLYKSMSRYKKNNVVKSCQKMRFYRKNDSFLPINKWVIYCKIQQKMIVYDYKHGGTLYDFFEGIFGLY